MVIRGWRRQPVSEADDAVALCADRRRDRRDALLAVEDDPLDVGGQLNEREAEARRGRAQGYGGVVPRVGITGSASVPLMVIAGMQR